MFEKSFQNLSIQIGILWSRLMFGGLMFFGHGLGKLDRLSTAFTDNVAFKDRLNLQAIGFDPVTAQSLNLIGIVFAEALCAMLVMVGLATRLSAVTLVFAMGVAAFVAHGADPVFKTEGFRGYKEPALMFLTAFGAIALLGPGRFSADHYVIPALKKRREARAKKEQKEQKKG